MGNDTPLLSVRDLAVGYQAGDGDVLLVRDVSFDVAAGEVVCLVGESGSGKTLTGRAVLGLLRHSPRLRVGGSVMFGGRELTVMPERELRGVRGREIGMIFQDPVAALDPVVRVGDQIAEAISRSGRGRRRATRARVTELLAQVGITDPELRARQFPHEISGGMCQRVLIAIALAGDPALLIADEPTTALDVTIQAQVLNLLSRLRGERGLSVLLITHDMGVAAQMADRILVMYAGSLVEVAPTTEFFARPGHPYSLGLVQAVPRVDAPRTRRMPVIPGSVPEAGDLPPGCAFHPRCPLRLDVCRTEEPPLTASGQALVACHRSAELRADPRLPVWAASTAGVGRP
jgi:oligopeptide/dipeptide ABC transporter ATP-binding protein